MRSPWRVALALLLAAALVYTVVWYGRAALVAAGLVFVLLVVCVSLALAAGLVRDRLGRGTGRSRTSVPDHVEHELAVQLVLAELADRRTDPAFKARLRRRLVKDRTILDRLARGGGS